MNKLNVIPNSELILNDDGSIYHLKLKPEDVADDIIVVGDQDRVEMISRHFDSIVVKKQNREFVTHSGYIGNKFLTVLSTGIGTDNIDIVINELDAVVNIDLDKRIEKDAKRKLNIIRLGTSGGLHPSVSLDSFMVSEYAVGLDGLLHFYNWDPTDIEKALQDSLKSHFNWPDSFSQPYVAKASENLLRVFEDSPRGITLTAPGFYAPQGRQLRLKPALTNLHQSIEAFSWQGRNLTNFEMESAAIQGLGKLLNHECLTICAIIANRATGEFSKDHSLTVEKLIEYVISKLTA